MVQAKEAAEREEAAEMAAEGEKAKVIFLTICSITGAVRLRSAVIG